MNQARGSGRYSFCPTRYTQSEVRAAAFTEVHVIFSAVYVIRTSMDGQ